MYVKYTVEINDRVYDGDTNDIFNIIGDAEYYKKRIYIYPSETEEKVWLWSAGYVKMSSTMAITDRILQSRCAIHYCVKGKGYYNGTLITKGTGFVSWNNKVHSLISDPNDPIEYYWIMIRGDEVTSYVREFSFRPNALIFECDYINDVTALIDCLLNTDYEKVYLPKYSSSMMTAILSFHIKNNKSLNIEDTSDNGSNHIDYVEAAKNILYDNNYSLSVSQISKMLGVTPRYLIRIFRRTVGESPKQYSMRKRLALGCMLLEKGTMPTVVSNILKFSDYASFYRAFMKEYNMAPGDYQRNKKSL